MRRSTDKEVAALVDVAQAEARVVAAKNTVDEARQAQRAAVAQLKSARRAFADTRAATDERRRKHAAELAAKTRERHAKIAEREAARAATRAESKRKREEAEIAAQAERLAERRQAEAELEVAELRASLTPAIRTDGETN